MEKRPPIPLCLKKRQRMTVCEPMVRFAEHLAESKRKKRRNAPAHPPQNVPPPPPAVPPPPPAVHTPPIAVSSKKKQMHEFKITIGKSMQLLAKRIAQENKISKKSPADPTPVVSDPPAAPVPRHAIYQHKRIVAFLSIGGHGFTLSNVVKSVTEEAGPCDVVQAVLNMNVRQLYCFDEYTFNKWKQMQNDSKYKFSKLIVVKLKPFPRIRCTYCKQKICHKWNASSAIAHQLQIPFDPIIHSEIPEPGYNIYFHQKIAAVLCIALNGFTLCNAVQSVYENGHVSNSRMAQEVLKMKVTSLSCFDQNTHDKWMDVQESYRKEFKNLKVALIEPIKMKLCDYCHEKTCHKWRASVAMSYKHKLLFDPIEH